jgi:hypothetical protein
MPAEPSEFETRVVNDERLDHECAGDLAGERRFLDVEDLDAFRVRN